MKQEAKRKKKNNQPNKSGYITYQNLRAVGKAVLMKAIYCNKPKIKIRFQINNLMMHLVDIEKQE